MNTNIATPPKRSKAPLIWVLIVCTMPTIAAFAVYYFMKWQPNVETTNYGTLVLEQPDLPDLKGALTDEGKPFEPKSIYKQWVYLTVDSGQCEQECAQRLFITRQLRAQMGRERERVERVWLVTDNAPIVPQLKAAHPDLLIARVNPDALGYLKQSTVAGTNPHIWIADPQSHIMMKYAKDADPTKMKSDLSKLLYASKGWQQ